MIPAEAEQPVIRMTFWESGPATIRASYWRIVDGWVTLKDMDGNPLAAFTERSVATIHGPR